MTYTDEQIGDACDRCVDSWNINELKIFVAEELYHYYTTQADPDILDFFMNENKETKSC